jgi:hypothetical protein
VTHSTPTLSSGGCDAVANRHRPVRALPVRGEDAHPGLELYEAEQHGGKSDVEYERTPTHDTTVLLSETVYVLLAEDLAVLLGDDTNLAFAHDDPRP